MDNCPEYDYHEINGEPVAEQVRAWRSRVRRAAICRYVTGMYRIRRKRDDCRDYDDGDWCPHTPASEECHRSRRDDAPAMDQEKKRPVSGNKNPETSLNRMKASSLTGGCPCGGGDKPQRARSFRKISVEKRKPERKAKLKKKSR